MAVRTGALTPQEFRNAVLKWWTDDYDHRVDEDSPDFGALRDRFLAYLPRENPHPRVVDLGCGSGFDLAVFAARGCDAVGIEPVASAATAAGRNSGCVVHQQHVMDFSFGVGQFDGVFAKALLQLLHEDELPELLSRLKRALKPGGVLFVSVWLGDDDSGAQIRGERRKPLTSLRAETWARLFVEAGFRVAESEDSGPFRRFFLFA
jgi:SAM-dependent methyltransferase